MCRQSRKSLGRIISGWSGLFLTWAPLSAGICNAFFGSCCAKGLSEPHVKRKAFRSPSHVSLDFLHVSDCIRRTVSILRILIHWISSLTWGFWLVLQRTTIFFWFLIFHTFLSKMILNLRVYHKWNSPTYYIFFVFAIMKTLSISILLNTTCFPLPKHLSFQCMYYLRCIGS